MRALYTDFLTPAPCQEFWWNLGVGPNQYGMPGRAARNWGQDTLEGDLDEETLKKNRRDQTVDTAIHKYRDEEYYRTRNFNPEDITTPVLSVANWVNYPPCLVLIFCIVAEI